MTRRPRIALAGGLAGRVAVIAAVILVPCGAGAQEFPEPAFRSLRTALAAYEEVRSELAADRLDGVPDASARLGDALRLALEGSDALAGRSVAESMAEAEDLEAARAAFGEVSRLLMVLADRDPRLAEGWHAFVCPMASHTYGKWIQPTEELENPYMGPSMLRCGATADWSVPAASLAEATRESASPGEPVASGTEPIFKPGIPGVRMEDVRDHRFLWREIEELQLWERRDRISVAEYRSKAIEKTSQFLELGDSAADEFAVTASEAVTALRESFRQGHPRSVDAPFSDDLAVAVTRVTSLLQEEPRHLLFAPDCKKWLLTLAFGPKESKESKESREAEPEQAETAESDKRGETPGMP